LKIKRIKKLKINCYEFKVIWNKEHSGGIFNYRDKTIDIGIKLNNEDEVFMIICHEVMEIIAIEMNVRLSRPDCDSDYIFVYDHRQHETMMNMFSSVVSRFIY
jgi:hypothetical protein